jgi:sec-independent protein translocase protein TatB
MFDFGLSFSHILVIVVLAVIAIGPRDLPVVLRRFGQFMNKMRGMAREFQGQVDAAMKDAGMEDVKQDLMSLKSGVSAAISPVQTIMTSAASAATSAPAASPVSGAPQMMKMDGIAGNDFARLFGDGAVGETRVAGRGLEDSKP